MLVQLGLLLKVWDAHLQVVVRLQVRVLLEWLGDWRWSAVGREEAFGRHVATWCCVFCRCYVWSASLLASDTPACAADAGSTGVIVTHST